MDLNKCGKAAKDSPWYFVAGGGGFREHLEHSEDAWAVYPSVPFYTCYNIQPHFCHHLPTPFLSLCPQRVWDHKDPASHELPFMSACLSPVSDKSPLPFCLTSLQTLVLNHSFPSIPQSHLLRVQRGKCVRQWCGIRQSLRLPGAGHWPSFRTPSGK